MPRKIHPSSLLAAFSSFWSHRDLLWQLTKRDVLGRYRGSLLGVVWSLFNPFMMLAVYTFVFSVIFRMRWEGSGEGKTEFAMILFVGMIIHGLFAECINRSPGLILSNVNYVKKVVFPLEILPWMSLGAALFHACASLLALLLVFAAVNLTLNWTVLLLPVLLFPLLLLTMGISWFLASIGVYYRDVGQVTGIATSILLFMAPVFYPVSALPEQYRPLLYLNPLTFMIEQARNILILGRLPDWQGLALYSIASLVVAWLGFAWFQKTRKGFADVL